MKQTAGTVLSRRRFVTIAAGVTAAWTAPWILGGCSSGPQSADGQNVNDAADNGAGAGDTETAAAPASRFNPASFTVADALGDTYRQALAKAQEIAPDAMLFALRSSHAVTPGEAVTWDYMFASQKELRYYIAFTGNTVSVSELGKCTMKFAEWENVPPVDDLKVDAAAAYENICTAAADMPEPTELYGYLILYSEEADTAATEYSYSDEPLTWYFEFTLPEESDKGAEGATDSDDSEESVTSPIAAGDDAAMTVWAVNAETGETTCIVE